MFQYQNEAPSLEDHPCLVAALKDFDAPFEFTEVQIPPDGPKQKRWVVCSYPVGKSGRISKKLKINLPLAFCPFCGSLLTPVSDVMGNPLEPLPINEGTYEPDPEMDDEDELEDLEETEEV